MRERLTQRLTVLTALRRRHRSATSTSGLDAQAADAVDVEELLRRYTVEDLAQSAEEYFSRLPSWDPQRAKPFYSLDEAPHLLLTFGALLAGLDLSHGQDVVDFGAGSGWTSWILSQLGCRVVATDVSETALELAAERYRRMPLIGDVPEPAFLRFDGHRFDLHDSSVDRVACNDAFHHVPNCDEVLSEMCRVLRPRGLCVMSEPGPTHSSLPGSQAEMRNFRVVERNIVLGEMEAQARAAGFQSVEVGIYGAWPTFVPAQDFDAAISPRSRLPGRLMASFLSNRRLLRLRKGGSTPPDSSRRDFLSGHLKVEVTGTQVRAIIENTGAATWIQAPGSVGHVNLGAHLFAEDGRLVDFDYLRLPLRSAGDSVAPGGQQVVHGTLPTAKPGRYRLTFDLVAEGVCWFAQMGSPTVTVDVTF